MKSGDADPAPDVTSPVIEVDTGSDSAGPAEGVALCLSGGGYRAMLFHLGALWRLNEAGVLKAIRRISSVSGGSVVAAYLGLETAWKRYETILVSDGGGKMAEEAEPKRDWARHMVRVLDIVDNQVRSLRKRQVIASFRDGTRTGAYWGIRTDIADFARGRPGLVLPLPCPIDRTMALASISTRLQRLDPGVQERLVNWGYAVCDAALRAHYLPDLKEPGQFLYPASGI
jgi:hypothetical protein